MREIKFKLYHPSRGMSGDYSLKSISIVIESWVEAGIKDVKEIIELEFTGLHDKNGKEIWEGDIIQECHVGEEIWDGDGVIKECPVGVVEWGHSGYNLKQKKIGVVDLKDGSKSELHLDKYDGQFQWDGTEIEVLGNIYSNPELLKATP